MPNVFGHGQVANRLATAMNLAAARANLGEALVETTLFAQFIWWDDPQMAKVVVHTQGNAQQTDLNREDVVNGGALPSGFAVK